MKRMILTGLLVLATGLMSLVGQSKKGKQAPAAQPPQQQQQPTGPAPKSQGEAQALQALVQSQSAGADTTIKAAEELLTKYADTDFKDVALLMEARAYQQKGDASRAQVFAERALDANPKNFQTTLLMGELLAQTTHENDIDREEKLTRAEKMLNQTISDLQTMPKTNPQISDQQWDEAKKYTIAEAHNALGLAQLDRKNYDVAIKEFTTAYTMDPQGAYGARLASAQQSAGKNEDAIATCDKVLADQQLHPAIRQVAQTVRAAAMKASGKAAPAPPAEKKQ